MLVGVTAGSSMFFSIDGFSDCNSTKMDPLDAEKTAFRTVMGNLHYIFIPFGLKNADASYQHAMTDIFHDMLHNFLEDYIDDIFVKSKKSVTT